MSPFSTLNVNEKMSTPVSALSLRCETDTECQALNDISHPLEAKTYAFFFLQIFGGHIGIPIILATFFLAKIRSHPLVVNLLVTWVIYTTSFCLLLYTGNQFTFVPPSILCDVQASFIYGAIIMVAMSGLAFVLNIWLCTRIPTKLVVGVNDLTTEREQQSAARIGKFDLLLGAPYIGFLACALFILIMSLKSRDDLIVMEQSLFYCAIREDYKYHVVPIIAGCIMTVALILEFNIAIRLYRMYKAFGHFQANKDYSLAIIVRSMLVSLCTFCALIGCIEVREEPNSMGVYLFQAALPTIIFLIFGTQAELIKAWGFVELWLILRQLTRRLSGRHRIAKEHV